VVFGQSNVRTWPSAVRSNGDGSLRSTLRAKVGGPVLILVGADDNPFAISRSALRSILPGAAV